MTEINASQINHDYEIVLEQLGSPELIYDSEKLDELLKRKAALEKAIEKHKELESVRMEIAESKSILSSNEDPELVSLAQTELNSLGEREKILENELKNILDAKKESRPRPVIIEIRAGIGGEEAAIFAGDLSKAYSKFAKSQGWSQKILDSSPSELGGLKGIAFELKNGDVYSKMRFEAGVHRVQRIPATEKSGRVHTSTATVAVLPKPEKTEIKINPADLKMEVYKSSGPGGQYVNKRETAVRITHLPTGLVVASQTERNLLQNKENAFSILSARLFDLKEKEAFAKMGNERKSQIGRAKRVEKIRTYNFPQDRVTDHRVKKTFHNIEQIMEGKLDPIIEALENSESDQITETAF